MAQTVVPLDGSTIDDSDHASISYAAAHAQSAYVIEGLEVTDNGGLEVSVAPGAFQLKGYYVVEDAAQTITLTDNDDNWIYIFGAGSFSTIKGIGSIANTAVSGQIVLAKVVTSGGSISSITHFIDNVSRGQALRIKASDTTRNSTTTLADDTDFRLKYEDGQKWDIEYRLIVNSGTTPDFKFDLDADGSPDVLHWWVEGTNSLETSSTSITTDGTDQLFVIRALLVTGAAGGASTELDLRWAQNTSDAGDTTVKAGSYMIARRILA